LDGLEDEPRVGRPKANLVVTEAERVELTRWALRAKTAQLVAMRARIVLPARRGPEQAARGATST
jgi:hypothetical protein